MLKRAPNVYVPLPAEDDGIALPTLLSIVVHGAIIAFIIFFNRIPSIDIPPTIETTIVTPEELAEIQAEIAANQDAMGADAGGDPSIVDNAETNDSATNSQAVNTSENSATNSSALDSESDADENAVTRVVRRSVSVFTRSDEDPDQSDEVDSKQQSTAANELKQQMLRKKEAYEAAQQEFQRQLESEMDAEMRAQQQALAAEEQARLDKLKELHQKEDNPPAVEKPKRVDKSFPPSITGEKSDSSNNTSQQKVETTNQDNQNVDASSAASNINGSGAASGSNTGTGGNNKPINIISALVSHIRPYWNPPTGRVGKSVTVKVKVDAYGNVLSVSADSDDAALNKSLEDAVKSASPLTPVIGTDYRYLEPTFKVKK